MGAEGIGDFAEADRRETELAGMRAVMAIERSLGYEPEDVSDAKCGYDVESRIPDDLRDGGNVLRLIEVKGRRMGADTVTVSKNEVLCALNSPENFILALVEVGDSTTKTTYLKRPFSNALDFSATCVVYDIKRLMENAEVVYEKEETRDDR